MGRKTFESIGRLLPGRTTVVLTRQIKWEFPGCRVAHDLDQYLKSLPAIQSRCGRRAEIYRWLLPWNAASVLDASPHDSVGDAWLPQINWEQWHRTGESVGRAMNATNLRRRFRPGAFE